MTSKIVSIQTSNHLVSNVLKIYYYYKIDGNDKFMALPTHIYYNTFEYNLLKNLGTVGTNVGFNNFMSSVSQCTSPE